MAPRTDFALDLDTIVGAAFEIMHESGLDGLSMRKLAERLSVQPSSLYWHCKGKAELLALMGSAIYSDAVDAVDAVFENREWREWLMAFGESLARLLRQHHDAAHLMALAIPGSNVDWTERNRKLAEPLVRLGLNEQDALDFVSSIICFSIGWFTMYDNPAMRTLLKRLMRFERSYQVGLRSLVRGFELGEP